MSHNKKRKFNEINEGSRPVTPTASPIELTDADLSIRDALLQICDEAVVWQTPDGTPHVTVPVDGHFEHHPLLSREFQNWMLQRFAKDFTRNGRPASASETVIRDVRATVEARGFLDKITYRAELRSISHEDTIYIDLGTPDRSVIVVRADGFQIETASPIPILRSKRTAEFSMPGTRGSWEPLRKLLGHLDEDTFILFVSSCLSALLPWGPYPILVLSGEQGCGKSTLARVAGRLTDPVTGDLLQPPANDRDLIAAARSNRVLAFDNVSSMKPELADSFCRLSTGAEIGGRALYTDHDMASFSASRPVILNGIPDLAARGDLADRAIFLHLPKLESRITERDWKREVEAILPATLTAFLEAIVCGLRNVASTETPDVRMADFAQFIQAAEPALPWSRGQFLEAYRTNRAAASAILTEGDCVANALLEFMNTQGASWSGLASDLYGLLSKISKRDRRLPRGWPGNTRWFSERLRRATPALRAMGLDVRDRRKRDGMHITVSRLDTSATSDSCQHGPSPTANGSDDVANDANVAQPAHPKSEYREPRPRRNGQSPN